MEEQTIKTMLGLYHFDPKIVLDIKQLVKSFGTKLKRYGKGHYAIIKNGITKNLVNQIVKDEEIQSLAITKKYQRVYGLLVRKMHIS